MKLKELTKGIFKENPTFIIMLGLCPTLAVSTKLIYALGMGAAATFVLIGSNIIISLLKRFIPEKVRIPGYIVVIATFVTIVDLSMQAFSPDLSKSLGVFVPLIVVNCIILGRAEAFANKNSVGDSILDAIGMGIGFTLSLALIALIREMLGSGTITLFPLPISGMEDGIIEIPGIAGSAVGIFVAPAGALLVIGLLKGFFNAFGGIKKRLGALVGSVANLFRRKPEMAENKEGVGK